MKGRWLEKMAAVACALTLTVGVMSGAFAKAEEPSDEPAAPEATFVVLDLQLDGEASAADATSDEAALAASDTEASGVPAAQLEVTDNRSAVPLWVNGEEAGECLLFGGIPYVGAESFCRALGMNVAGGFVGDAYVLAGDIDLEAVADAIYFVCNDRYLLVENGVRVQDGQAYLPVEAMAKCLNVSAAWDRVQWTISVTADTIVPLESGGDFYDETDVYWLSHVIYAEAGNQSLRGQVAVGNVVLNRVASDEFTGQDNVYDVIFAKNQFEVVINGMIYMEPNEDADIAAKLALEGYDVCGGSTYFATFDFGEGYECVMWIGDHCFMVSA